MPLNPCGTVAQLLAECVCIRAPTQELHSCVGLTQLVKHRDQRHFTAGRGKQWLPQQFDDMLSGEVDYFAEDTLRQVEEPERWNLSSTPVLPMPACQPTWQTLRYHLNLTDSLFKRQQKTHCVIGTVGFLVSNFIPLKTFFLIS